MHDNAFEDLVTFLLVLDDADVDLDGVAAREIGNILAKLTGWPSIIMTAMEQLVRVMVEPDR